MFRLKETMRTKIKIGNCYRYLFVATLGFFLLILNLYARSEDAVFNTNNKLFVNGTYTFIVDEKSEVICWGGSGNYGQLSYLRGGSSSAPITMFDINNVSKISAGTTFTIILKNDGTVWGLGASNPSQEAFLGVSTGDSQYWFPMQIPISEKAISIDTGKLHSIALVEEANGDKTVYTWGSNSWGQLATGGWSKPNTIHKVEGIPKNIKEVYASATNSAVITDDGDLYVWGYDLVGNGTYLFNPTKINSVSMVEDIALGDKHLLVLTKNGELFGFGEGNSGEFADHASSSSKGPKKINTPVSVKKLAGLGNGFSAYLGIDGKLYTSGNNDAGQLGNGTYINSTSFKQVNTLSDVVEAKIGDNFGVAIDKSGQVWTWGSNNVGQLGVSNKLSSRSLPEIVSEVDLSFKKSHITSDNMESTELLESDNIIYNPYMGPTTTGSPNGNGTGSMYGFILAFWKDIEPVEGKINFEHIEKNYNLADWRDAGGSVVFRLVLDYPPEVSVLPDWLINKLSNKNYDNDGVLIIDYSDPTLIKAHNDLIKALAEKYNDDPAIDSIQFGSIGHWGEFHCANFPNTETTRKYLEPYFNYFNNKMFMFRRSHILGWKDMWPDTSISNSSDSDYIAGKFNDILGYTNQTGGVNDITTGYPVKGGTEDYPSMPDIWKTQISGGEVASDSGEYGPLLWFLNEDDRYKYTYEQFKLFHITYAGMFLPSEGEQGIRDVKQYVYAVSNGQLNLSDEKAVEIRDNILSIVKKMGYRFWVSKVEVDKESYTDSQLNINLIWENTGFAPFYKEGWKLEISILSEDKKLIKTDILDEDIRKWLPEQQQYVKHKMTLPKDIKEGNYYISVAIKNHNDNSKVKTPSLKLANEVFVTSVTDQSDNLILNHSYILTNVNIKERIDNIDNNDQQDIEVESNELEDEVISQKNQNSLEGKSNLKTENNSNMTQGEINHSINNNQEDKESTNDSSGSGLDVSLENTDSDNKKKLYIIIVCCATIVLIILYFFKRKKYE